MTRTSPVPPNFASVPALIEQAAVAVKGKIRNRGREAIISPCPISGCKGDKFAINVESGAWNCPKCGERGNGWKLAKILRLVPILPVNGSPGAGRYERPKPRITQGALDQRYATYEADLDLALAFLESRGLTLETARHFRLSVRSGSVGLPYFRDNGNLAFVKWRGMADKSMSRSPITEDMPLPVCTPLFHGYRLNLQKPVILTEGEWDAMALWQCGIANVASVTNGANGWSDEWSVALATCPQVVIAYDQDPDGEKGYAKVRDRFGRERVARLVFGDHKDANDALLAGWGPQEFGAAVGDARMEPPEILQYAKFYALEIAEDIRSGAGPEPILTGVGPFDETQRGIRPGEFSVLTAHSGEGKTTWALDLCLALAERGVPACFFTMEQQPRDTVEQIMGMCGKCAAIDMTPDQADKVAIEMPEALFIGAEPETDRVKAVLDAIRYAKIVHDVRFFVVDHLDFLIETAAHQGRYDAATHAVKSLHAAARDYHVHVLLICQPTTESGRSRTDKPRRMGIEHIAETRAARQLAHNGYVWQSSKEHNTGTLYVQKARFGPAKDNVTLRFHFDGFRFTEAGWERGRADAAPESRYRSPDCTTDKGFDDD